MSRHRVYGKNLQTQISECRTMEELQSLMSRIVKANLQGLVSEGTLRKLDKRARIVAQNLRASRLILPPSSLVTPPSPRGLIMPS